MSEFVRHDRPFLHWIDEAFLSPSEVRDINESWPAKDDDRWMHERREYATKSAIMFPRRLHSPAQALAERLYSPEALRWLSGIVGVELLADPWFLDGPLMPRVGGGLHEIGPGGRLGIHTDFDAHPTGLTRAVNLLIYLNEGWRDEWGGALELHGDGMAEIYPRGGTAVIFPTNGDSWHGHPKPLSCPPDRARRSLAMYYYKQQTESHARTTTVYR